MRVKPVRLRGSVETFSFRSGVLRGNPLGDPTLRDVYVYLPPEYGREPDRRFPLFVDIVGFMGSGAAHLNWKPFDESVPERIERLVRARKMGPVIAVFPDCWTRLGGNQYINSPAVGRYADYVIREVVPEVERRYRCIGGSDHRALFGKSSGGYGSMIHGMKYAKHWGAVACHSGDLSFELCYFNDIPRVCNTLARYGGSVSRFLKAIYSEQTLPYADGHVLMFLAMCAFYDPDPDDPKRIRLPMDAHTAEVDPAALRRWLRHDPVRLIDRPAVRAALSSLRGLYVDCGYRDQYHLHFGARVLRRKLREHGISHRYEEFDGTHSGIDYRMDVSLPYLYRALMGRKGIAR